MGSSTAQGSTSYVQGILKMGVFIQRNGTVEWNGGMERWNGMEWNGGMTTPTERGLTTYTHYILQPFSNHGHASGSS
jgi:hypothetical protein